MSYQPAITINATEVGKVEHILCLSGRIARIIAIIRPHGYHIILSPVQYVRDIDHHRQITAKMFSQQLPVDKYLALSHDGFEVQEQFLPLQSIRKGEVLTIPDFSLIIDATTGFCRQIFNAIGQRDYRPFRIIKVRSFSTRNGSFIKAPGRIHGKHFTPGIGQLEETGSRKLGLMRCLHSTAGN